VKRPSIALTLAALTTSLTIANEAGAWAEHEHVRIGEAMAKRAFGDDRFPTPSAPWSATLLEAWASLRASSPRRKAILCADPRATYGDCLGLADLPMLAADHACSVGALESNLDAPWVKKVLATTQIAAQSVALVEMNRETDDRDEDRLRARRSLDVNLQAADPSYLKNMTSGPSHFAIFRANADEDLRHYLARATRRDAQTNAYAFYTAFQALALRYALGASRPGIAPAERANLTWWALLEESFALHFLEDSFSIGHVVSAFADTPYRNGTHDFYNRQSLDVEPWSGSRWVARGDAFLTSTDEARASIACVASLRQLAWALDPTVEDPGSGITATAKEELFAITADPAMDTCVAQPLDGSLAPLASLSFLPTVLDQAPKPSTESPGVPKYRAELGMFIPVTLGFDVTPAYATSSASPHAAAQGRATLGVGFGFASDGPLGESQDALAFGQLVGTSSIDQNARATLGFGFAARAPFAYLPLDLILFGPLAFAGVPWASHAVGDAIRGNRAFFGLFGNTLYDSSTVRLQLDLGREAITQFHVRLQPRAYYASWDVTLPALSLRIAHPFVGRLGDDVMLRLGLRVGNSWSLTPEAPTPEGPFLGAVMSFSNAARLYL
jgi:hypothetical protein